MTFLRCTVKDEGSYVIKAINNIGSDTRSWKIVVVAAQPNMLLHTSKGLPEGNQFLYQNKNNVHQSDNNSINEVVEVRLVILLQTTKLLFNVTYYRSVEFCTYMVSSVFQTDYLNTSIVFFSSSFNKNPLSLNKIFLSTKATKTMYMFLTMKVK